MQFIIDCRKSLTEGSCYENIIVILLFYFLCSERRVIIAFLLAPLILGQTKKEKANKGTNFSRNNIPRLSICRPRAWELIVLLITLPRLPFTVVINIFHCFYTYSSKNLVKIKLRYYIYLRVKLKNKNIFKNFFFLSLRT